MNSRPVAGPVLLSAFLLALWTGSAHASLSFDLSTDFGQGQIEFGSTQGYQGSSTAFIDPSFSDGSAGSLLGFSFDVSFPNTGQSSFTEADLFFVEWLVQGHDLSLRLFTFREADDLQEGITLLSAGATFSQASDTYCSSIGLADVDENAACVIDISDQGFILDALTSDSLVAQPTATVPEPATLLLLGLGLAGLRLCSRRR